MKGRRRGKGSSIRPEMTLLDILKRYPATEGVFETFDRQAGVCLRRHAL
jgi:hypothetical protein